MIADDSPKPARSRPLRPDVEPLWHAYWKEPSVEHRNRLVELYQPLVRDLARRFSLRLPRTVDKGDLETAANVGLMAAVEGYDPARRVRFESYAETRIRGALFDELRSEDWLPRPWRQRVEMHKRAVERLRAELGREPRDEELAAQLGLTVAVYETQFGTGLPAAPTGSMPADEHGEEPASSLEILPDNRHDEPGVKLTRDEILRLVAQRLTQQEYRIVYLKYWEELPMREIGQLTNLSESRVCKIHSRLIDRLRDRFRVGADEG